MKTFSSLLFPWLARWARTVLFLSLAALSAHAQYVGPPPKITRQPVSRIVALGSTVTFDVAATSYTTAKYQWLIGGALLAGATNTSLTLTNVSTRYGGNYVVTVTNPSGTATSDPVNLTVVGVADQSGSLGATVSLKASVGGAVQSYAWQFNGANIPGATGPLLIFTNLQPAVAGVYALTASNSAGTVSLTANLTVDPTFTKIPPGLSITSRMFNGVWGDYDGDGFLDMFITGHLLRNKGDGTFLDIGNNAMNGVSDFAAGLAWADYDNDGWLDLLVARGPGNSFVTQLLAHNQGDGTFTVVKSPNALGGLQGDYSSAAWFDFDNDGFVDALLTANAQVQRNALFRNDHGTNFIRITHDPVVLEPTANGYPAAADYDNDGFVDLFVINNGGRNVLFHNNGDGTFIKITSGAIAEEPGNGNPGGVSWGDYDNDGYPDLFVANISTNSVLFHNNGDGTFTKMPSAVLPVDSKASDDAAWVDYDNDGFLDLYVSRGAGNPPTVNSLFHNNGDGTFTRVTTGSPVNDVGVWIGVSGADYDNDGFPDLFTSSGSDKPALYRNNGNSNAWAKFRLVGVFSNRSAIGAKVRVLATIRGRQMWQRRELSTGDGFNENGLRADFGLGDATKMDTVRIEWPSGIVQELHDVAPKQNLTITESGVAISPLVANLVLGSNHVFTARSTDSNLSRFQWRFNGADLPGETNSTLTIRNAQAANAGSYTVVAQTETGAQPVSGSPALLRLQGPPVILMQPRSQLAVVGTDVSLSVQVPPSSTPLTYQWQRNGVPVPGPQKSTLLLTNATADLVGTYSVTVTNQFGSVTSQDAFLAVIKDASAPASFGGTAVLNIGFSSPGPIAFQWRLNGLDIPGATNRQYTIKQATAQDMGQYSVVVTTPFASLTNLAPAQMIDGTFTKITSTPITSDYGGTYWGDYDNDGWIDLLIAGPSNHLYHNNGDSTFTLVTGDPLQQNSTSITGGPWADYDNDGRIDLFSAESDQHPKEFLFHNDGNGKFSRVTTGAIVTNAVPAFAPAWADYDRDGWLDLFVFNVGGGVRNNHLYHNLGNGTFERITSGLIVNDGSGASGQAWGDYDNDGFPDLALAIESPSKNYLYHNNGDGTFTQLLPFADPTASSWGVTWADYDNDGFLDIAFNNYGGKNALFHNNGDGTFTRVISGPVVTSAGNLSMGFAFGDYDNDGWLDLYVSNNGSKDYLYHNNGDGTFSQVTTGSIPNESQSTAVGAWGDYNNDGFLDLAVGRFSGQNALYLNNGNSNHWVKFVLHGQLSNRSAVGAKVRLNATINGKNFWQLREVSAGTGWEAQDDPRPHFGLGDAPAAETVRVEWPSGIVQEFHQVQANQILPITEPILKIGPNSVAYAVDTDITFNVSTNATISSQYQWRLNGVDLPGETNATTTIHISGRRETGKVTVVVTLPSGDTVESPAGVIQSPTPPTITQQPSSVTVDPGADASFTVAATGSPPLSYQWQLEGTALPGMTNSTLTISNAQPTDVGAYSVIVTNAASSVTSSNALLSLVGAPAVTGGPKDQSVSTGANVSFTITGGGSPPLFYQWRINGVDLPGATNRSLLLTNVSLTDSGKKVSVFLQNPLGSTLSREATLDVDGTFRKIMDSPITKLVAGGGGASWGDFNDDGWLDLFVSRNDNGNTLFVNQGDGTFEKASLADARPVLAPLENFISPIWADIDNDGNLDLFNIRNGSVSGPNELYVNLGNGAFKRLTPAEAGPIVVDGFDSNSAAWADYDRDGFVDLAVARWISPGAAYLYHNNGDSSFRAITNSVITQPFPGQNGNKFGVAWGDFNNDGYPDLAIGGHGQQNALYRNNGDGTFSLVSFPELSPKPYKSGMPSWADYDNDGYLDLFIPVGNEPTNPVATNLLFHNNRDGTFTRITNGVVVSDPPKPFAGAIGAWGDYDNDGYIDLYVANQAVDSAGNTSGRSTNFLYHNNGDGTFTRMTRGSPVNDAASTYHACWGDYDNDGFLDLFVLAANGMGFNLLYHNNGNPNGWIKFKLIGGASNRSAIGAKVHVLATIRGKSIWQLREVISGGGFGSPNQLEPHFGLGDAKSVDTVRIEWPSGAVQELHDVAPRQFLTMVEPPQLGNAQGQPDGSVQLNLVGAAGLPFRVEVSTDLSTWRELTTLTNRTRVEVISDKQTPSTETRFYRAIGP